jgi:putative aldouronate transport system substrate-binding protein
MKNWKNLFAMLLAVMMVVSIFAGCSNNDSQKDVGSTTPANNTPANSANSETNASEEPVTITIMANFDRVTPGGEKWLEGIEEKLNINIEWQLPPSSGYEDTLQIMVLSDDRPDVVILPDTWRTSDVFAESCEGGIFQDISGLLPNYKNIMDHTAQVSWDALDIFNDGRIWGMPRSTVMRADGFVFDEQFLEALNIDYTEGDYLTTDEFFDILYQFTYGDPDGNGIDDTYGLRAYVNEAGDLVTGLGRIFGIGDTAAWREYDGEIDCLNYSKTRDNYKQYLAFLNKCWEAGVIDPDAFSLDRATAVERDYKLMHGCWGEYAGNTVLVPYDLYAHTQVYCPGVVPNKGDTYGYGDFGTGIWWYWAITSNCEHPDKVLELFDYMLSDEDWTNLSAQGLEGYNFVIDENGDYDFSLNDALPDDAKGAWPIGRFVRRSDGAEFFINKGYSKEQRERIAAMMDENFANYIPSLDRGYKPEIASDPVFIEYENYMKDEINKIITGSEPVDHWDEVLDGWYAAGGETYCQQMRDYIASFEN